MTPHMEKKQRKKREGPPRQPTAYNNFMKAELAKIKQENSEMHHREAFKIAAARWAESSENPKNQKAGAVKPVTDAEAAPEAAAAAGEGAENPEVKDEPNAENAAVETADVEQPPVVVEEPAPAVPAAEPTAEPTAEPPAEAAD